MATTTTTPSTPAVQRENLRAKDSNFRLVERPREETPENEIRVTNNGRITTYVSYAARLLKEENKNTVSIRGSGSAVPYAIATAEILRHRVLGLHMQTETGVAKLVETYEPLKEGLDSQQRTRNVPYISITLAKKEEDVDKHGCGYSPPVDGELVQDFKPPRTGRGPQRRVRRNPRSNAESSERPAAVDARPPRRG